MVNIDKILPLSQIRKICHDGGCYLGTPFGTLFPGKDDGAAWNIKLTLCHGRGGSKKHTIPARVTWIKSGDRYRLLARFKSHQYPELLNGKC